ncbi:hypothetical protein [Aquimarina agarivorans]|uniref:hypothetical protein n=1 Tax=Aquimarina agarivorans TaxID=980584 RepID=UPI000248E990|nr:hypothetical protein [Aquimarina agarivorans]
MKEELLKEHWFWKYAFVKDGLFKGDVQKINNNINLSVKVFYCLLLSLNVEFIFYLNNYLDKNISDALWPVFFVDYLPKVPWISVLIIVSFLINLLAVFNFKSRLVRILLFLSCFMLFALFNSAGKINHSLHTILIPLFFFSFLNFKEESKIYVNKIIFASSVFALLTTYSFAGFWKILRGFLHIIQGENGIFSTNAMTRLLQYQYRYDTPTFFGNFLIENEFLGCLLLWLGILIEFTSVIIFFKAKLHVVWGVLLLSLHISIALIMDVFFSNALISLLPLLILSPFLIRKKRFFVCLIG